MATPIGNKTHAEIRKQIFGLKYADQSHRGNQERAVEQESSRWARQPPNCQRQASQNREAHGNTYPPIPRSNRFTDEERENIERRVGKD